MFQFPFRFLSLGTLLLCAAALFALQLLPERRAALAAAGACLRRAADRQHHRDEHHERPGRKLLRDPQPERHHQLRPARRNTSSTAPSSYEAIWAQPARQRRPAPYQL